VPTATSATTAGTVTTAAQPNITSVGTLSSLAVTGNTTSGNFVGTLNGSAANVTNINASNISSGTLEAARLSGTYSISTTGLAGAATNIRVLATDFPGNTAAGGSSVALRDASGDIFATTFRGSGAGLTSIPGANVTGTVPSATTAGTVTTAAQPNITSVGTLSSLAVTGNITAGNVSATLFTGTATQARYADLAENYAADANYEPGTVLIFGGTAEVTVANAAGDTRIAGVVSTDPAHLMNSTIDCEHPAAVALTGRVPTRVIGTVRKGDMMVAAGNGQAQACSTPVLGSVIGKALADFDGTSGVIEVVVGRL
jgi:hypothetical protein